MDVEIEQPHVHHHPTGHRWLDLTLPLVALFLSFLAILIAWHHSQIMRELVHENERIVAAQSLPYLDIYSSDLASDRKPVLRLAVENEGVGPARIAEVVVTVNGEPVPDFNTLVDECCARGLLQSKGSDAKQYRSLRNGEVVLSSLRNRMIRPGEDADVFAWPITPENKQIVDRLQRGLATDLVNISVCYCSVFDDCWVRTDSDRRPSPVKECPMAAVPYRQ
jgi:hypothetical protein